MHDLKSNYYQIICAASVFFVEMVEILRLGKVVTVANIQDEMNSLKRGVTLIERELDSILKKNPGLEDRVVKKKIKKKRKVKKEIEVDEEVPVDDPPSAAGGGKIE